MAQYQPLEINDFSGGMTDNLHQAKPNQYYLADNLLVNNDLNLETRPGSSIYSSTFYTVPNSKRVGKIINFQFLSDILFQAKDKIYYLNSGVATELLGPSSHSAFSLATIAGQLSSAELNQHLYLVHDEGNLPVKIYQDGSNAYQIRTAGLPPISDTANYVSATVLASALTLANDIRTTFLAHLADNVIHAQADTVSGAGIGSAATDLPTLLILTGQLSIAYRAHYEDAVKLQTYHVAYTLNSGITNPVIFPINPSLTSTSTPTTLEEAVTRINDIRKNYQFHDGDIDVHNTVSIGSHQVGTAKLDSLTSGPSPNTSSLQDLYNLANHLKQKFNAHITDSLTGPFTGTFTSGSATITGISDTSSISIGQWLKVVISIGGASYYAVDAVLITGKTSTTLTVNANANTSASGTFFVFKHGLYSGTATSGSPNITGLTLDPAATGLSTGDMLFEQADLKLFPAGSTVSAITGPSLGVWTISMSLNALATGTGAFYFQDPFSDFTHLFPELVDYITTPDASTPVTLRNLVFRLRVAYSTHIFNSDVSFLPHFFVDIPESNFLLDTEFLSSHLSFAMEPDFFGGFQEDQIDGMRAALIELKTKYNLHTENTDIHYSGTSSGILLRNVATAPTETTANYIYAFHYFYEYTSGTLTFDNAGPVLIKQISDVVATNVQSLSITNIPTLSNTADTHYDTSNIKIKIYRTINNGTTLYLVGTVSNGTSSFTDSIFDEELTTGETIYTNGDVVDNDPPPVSRFIHVANSFGYYGDVTDAGERFRYRVRQTIQGDLDSAPGDFFIDLPSNVVGISSYRSIPVVFCERGIFRLSGNFDELGRGTINYDSVLDTIGCVSGQSIVQIKEGIVFAATDGFYFTDAYQCFKISNELNLRYQTLIPTSTQAKRINSVYDNVQNKVWFGVQASTDSGDNDSCWILDLDYGLKADSTFTSASNGGHFAPSALAFYNKQILRGDTRGHVFKHSFSVKTDPYIDPVVSAPQWGTKTILYDYISPEWDMGTTFARKWGTWIILTASNQGNASIQITSSNDEKGTRKPLKPIRKRSDVVWGDPAIIWGDPTIIWQYSGFFEEKRRFPSGGLRFTYKQIQITNAKVGLENSDRLGTAVIDKSNLTITLSNSATFDWPINAAGYFIAFDGDGYINEFEIFSQTPDTLTIRDPGGLCPVSGVYHWVIRGYPKDETLTLLSYNIHYTLMSTGEKAYQGSVADTGDNAS